MIFNGEQQPDGYPYITLNNGAMFDDWVPMIVWFNPEHGGFAEPYETHGVRSQDKDVARQVAQSWAGDLGFQYVEPGQPVP